MRWKKLEDAIHMRILEGPKNYKVSCIICGFFSSCTVFLQYFTNFLLSKVELTIAVLTPVPFQKMQLTFFLKGYMLL